MDSRLRGVKSRYLSREERSLRRNQITNALRKEKRFKIFNSFRGLDFDWFYIDLKENFDLDLDLTHILMNDIKSVQQLIDCINGFINTNNEKMANICIQEVKKLFDNNCDECKHFITIEFLQKLSEIILNQLISDSLKKTILELIESIVNFKDINDCLLITSGIMLSVMDTFYSFHIELVIKTVNVMRIMVNISEVMQTNALENGYIRLLLNIIDSTPVSKRKNKLSLNMYNFKIELIRAVSLSVMSLAMHLTNILDIKSVYHLLIRLIVSKDSHIIANILLAFNSMTSRNSESISLINNDLIHFITDLMLRSEVNIVLSCIQIWVNLIASKNFNFSAQNKFMGNLRTILEKKTSDSVIKEIANFLSVLLENGTNFMAVLIEFQIIPPLIEALKTVEYFLKQQLLSLIMKMLNSKETFECLIYFLNNGLIEALHKLIEIDETVLNIFSLEALSYILSIALNCGQLSSHTFRYYLSRIYELCENYVKQSKNECFLSKWNLIKETFYTNHFNNQQNSISISSLLK